MPQPRKPRGKASLAYMPTPWDTPPERKGANGTDRLTNALTHPQANTVNGL